MTARWIVVGDVHGCARELDALLAASAVRDADRVVFVGDLIAKGPDSRGVVRRARELGALAVRGNHDESALRWWRAVRDGREPPPVKPKHRPMVESLEREDWEWLDALPCYLELTEPNAIVVHGGLVRGLPLAAQDPELLMNMRSITPEGGPSTSIEAGEPWGARWPGPATAIFGHDAVRGLQLHPFAIGIDTGCVYGGELTAYVLPERRLVSVRAAQRYAAPGKEPE